MKTVPQFDVFDVSGLVLHSAYRDLLLVVLLTQINLLRFNQQIDILIDDAFSQLID